MEIVSRFFDIPSQSCFLFGPRGTGKSTWLRYRLPGALFLDLLEPALHRSLNARPERVREFLAGSPGTGAVVIDEIQRIPELLSVVHALLEEASPPRFILTGSSARKLRRGGVDLLGGRAVHRTMHPFMAAELPEFDLGKALQIGLLPLVVSAPEPTDVLDAYASLYLEQEVQAEGLTRNIGNFARFLEAISFSHGGLLNVSAVARECEVERKVVAGYIGILEDLLLAFRVPVFRKRAKRATVNHEKIYLFDAGVFRSLRPKGLLDRPDEIDGQALEGLVAQHLRAWAAYSRHHADLFYLAHARRDRGRLRGLRGIWGFRPSRSRTPAGSIPPTSGLSGHFATTIPRQRPPCSIAAGTGCGSTTSGACRSRTSFAGPHRTRVCWPGCEGRSRVATVETAAGLALAVLAEGARGPRLHPSRMRLSLRAFPTTDSDERLMAAAATMGDRSTPNIG